MSICGIFLKKEFILGTNKEDAVEGVSSQRLQVEAKKKLN